VAEVQGKESKPLSLQGMDRKGSVNLGGDESSVSTAKPRERMTPIKGMGRRTKSYSSERPSPKDAKERPLPAERMN